MEHTKFKPKLLDFGEDIIKTQKYKYFIFDCDGVLWTGRHVIKGSMQSLFWIMSQSQYKVFFLSNNALLDRANFYLKILKFFEENLSNEDYLVCEQIFKLESCYNAAYVLAKEVDSVI